MTQATAENYFCYVPDSRLCAMLGSTMISAGFTRVGRHSPYPAEGHPKDHHFNWKRGRILQDFQIVLISEGKGMLEYGRSRRRQPIAAGDVFMLFPNVWHRFAPDKLMGWTEHWIECRGTAFEMALASGLVDPNRPHYRAPDGIEPVFDEIHSLARSDSIRHQPVLSTLGLKLLALLSAPRETRENKASRLVDSARLLLMQRCTLNGPMEEIADELGVSYSYLRRNFRAATGMSLKEFQLSIRIRRAKDLLDNSDLSVKEIGRDLGFSSAFHFSSQFKRQVGTPPSGWRMRDGQD